MNSVKLTSNKTVYYIYNPESDKLAIRLEAEFGQTENEPLAEFPYVSLSRDGNSGTIVGFNVSDIQKLILENLIQVIFEQVEPYLKAATTSPSPEAESEKTSDEPAASKRKRYRRRTRKKKTTVPTEAQEGEPLSKPKDRQKASVADITPREIEPAKSTSPKRTREHRKKTTETSMRNKKTISSVEATEETTTLKPLSQPKNEQVSGNTAVAQEEVPSEEQSSGKTAVDEPSNKSSEEESAQAVAEVAEEVPSSEEVSAQAVAEVAEEVPSSEEVSAQAVAEVPSSEEVSAQAVAEVPSSEEVSAQIVASEPSNEPSSEEEGNEVAEEGANPSQKKPKKLPRKRHNKVTEEDSQKVVVEEPEEEEEEEEEKDTQKRRRRRRRRRKKKQDSSDVQMIAQAHEYQLKTIDDQLGTVSVVMTPELFAKNDPRFFYKSVPINGLDAPEAFAHMNIDPLLGQALTALGFEEPTPIQRRAIPKAMVGHDIIGLAQTGTGKTLAFLIPSLHQLIKTPTGLHEPRLLIVTPTRELALQVAQDAEYIATHTNLLITTIYGGTSFNQQLNELRSGTDVIVGTPGRLIDHIKRNNLSLNMIKVLVLDEADRMLDMGFLPEVRSILSKLPQERQTLLFSATMPAAIETLSKEFQRHPQLVEVARQVPPEAIDQRFYPVEKHLKVPLLIHLLQEEEDMTSVLVFTETKIEADVVARKLEGAGFSMALMHGDRSQREREQALQNLRTGDARILVATNVAARGLDIYDISHVINYDMPQTVDEYVHRIGRTARGNAYGKAYTFMTFTDEPMAKRIEDALEKELPREKAPNFNYDVPIPSWAKPSAEEILESLHKPQGLAERFERMMRRR